MDINFILEIFKTIPAGELLSILSILVTAAGTGLMAGFKYRRRAKKWEKEYWELKAIMDQMEVELLDSVKDYVDNR
ncbi:MAG: hypothetical protein ACRDAS_00910 [Cetobacterium sp.]